MFVCGEMFSTHFDAVNHYKATHCFRNYKCDQCNIFFLNRGTQVRAALGAIYLALLIRDLVFFFLRHVFRFFLSRTRDL